MQPERTKRHQGNSGGPGEAPAHYRRQSAQGPPVARPALRLYPRLRFGDEPDQESSFSVHACRHEPTTIASLTPVDGALIRMPEESTSGRR